MTNSKLLRPEPLANHGPANRRVRMLAVARIVLISVVVSELITLVLLQLLLGEILVEGLVIALVCSAPISAWIADRQLRMRDLIVHQRDQMRELNTELESRNRDLDAFARTVAHDLKNPLTTVVGMADLLLDDPRLASSEETRDHMRSILESGERATEIIDGLLLLHGIHHETHVLELVDADATVDTALETMSKTIEENNAVVTRSGSMLPVVGYRPWLTQVWINLIGNAIKYGGSPPTVDLAAHPTPDGMVRFEVKDNGAGIASVDHARVFREYERGSSTSVEGHGLGLAIVNRVVSRLDGDTGIDDADDGGSVFWFTVPAA